MWIYGTLARTRLDRAAEIVGHAHNTIDVPTCRWCAYVFLNSTRAAVKSIFRGKIESELTANVLMSPSSTQVVRRAKYHNRTRESSTVCCCRPFAIYAVKHEPAGLPSSMIGSASAIVTWSPEQSADLLQRMYFRFRDSRFSIGKVAMLVLRTWPPQL